MTFNELVTFATAMVTILNPIGNTALFAGLVSERSEGERRAIAWRCTLAVVVILVVSIWLGAAVLHGFGVSVASLEAAGGLVIALIAVSMLHSRQSGIHASGEGQETPAPTESIAIVPLAMPIVAGPGAIATVIVNAHKYQGLEDRLGMTVICIVVSGMIGLAFSFVGPITRLLGTAGISVVTKFMGLILLAIAMGMLANGAKGLLPGLAG
jgi:multiple antibiotic resistance protein